MAKHSLIRNPINNATSFGVVRNLIIPREPQLKSVEADIYLFLGFHKNIWGFGLKHIQHEHGSEIRNLGFIDEEGRTLLTEFVASIVRPGTKLYYTGESWPKCRLLVWNQNGRGILELRENNKHGKHWSIITVFPEKNPAGRFVGIII